MNKNIFGSKESWIFLLKLFIFGLIIVGFGYFFSIYFLWENYGRFIGVAVIAFLAIYYLKKNKDKNNKNNNFVEDELSEEKESKVTYTYGDLDNEIVRNRRLVKYSIISIILIMIIFLLLLNGEIELEILFNFLMLVFLFIGVIISPKVRNAVKKKLFIFLDVILYSAIIIGILWIVYKYILK